MNPAEARDRLRTMVAADTHPTLDNGELAELLDLSQRIDAAGRVITDPNWTPTFDLNAAAAEGWRWKAGKCSDEFNFSSGSDSYSRAQTYVHCMKMADEYQGKAGSMVRNLRSQGDIVLNRGQNPAILLAQMDQLGN